MSRVAVIGDALVDIVDGTAIPGGAALNVAVGLAVLGADVDLVAMLADDDAGRVLREHAERFGVHVHATPAPFGTAAATATRVGDSMRYEFNEAGTRRHVAVHAAAAAVDAADLVVLSCVQLDDPAQLAEIGTIRDAAARLVVDPNPRPGYLPSAEHVERFAAAVEQLAHSARLIKVGDEDAALVWGEGAHEVAARLVAAGTGAVLVTEGPAGATAHTATARIHAPIHAMRTPIVDTIGAGDATIAAVATALAAGPVDDEAWPLVLHEAMRIAAATCRVAGGELQVPTRETD